MFVHRHRGNVIVMNVLLPVTCVVAVSALQVMWKQCGLTAL